MPCARSDRFVAFATPGQVGASGADLAARLAAIERGPLYAHATWGYEVADVKSGTVFAQQKQKQMFDPGSTMKLYSVSAALRAYGPNYRFVTPIYRDGTVTSGTLNGNLILVASGDMSLGLREQPNGSLYYENLPKTDQSYADELPDAVEPPGNPLAGLDQLASDVRAAGITNVQGNVVIDDRLFQPHNFPDGLVSPIWVNENLIDLLVSPGTVGGPATIDWRPMTASYSVANRVTTVASTKSTSLNVTEPMPGTLVTGQIAAGSKPTLRTWNVDHPAAFARSALIEALQRAGVSVSAPATGANPDSLLPPKGSLPASSLLGKHVSATLSKFATLILKVSYNRGADLMTCLAAVKAGSTDCSQGLVAEVKSAEALGVSPSSIYPFDGAGTNDQGRTTPQALVTLLRNAARTSLGLTLQSAMPDLGRNGTLANVQSNSPAAGHAQVKTGNRVVQDAAGRGLVLGNTLAGYAETKRGRLVAFMIATGNVPIATPLEFATITKDQARMVTIIQQDL